MKRSLSLLLFLILPLLGGCLHRSTIKRETFAIAAPPLANNMPTNGPVLLVRRISVADQFDTPSFTYRTGEFAYERDPYAGFLDSPASSFNEPIRVYLQNSGLFSAVAGSDSSLRPDLQLETSIAQLVGDFRDTTRPLAVLELQFVVMESSGRRGSKIVFEKSYLRRIPLKGRTAGALVAGWNMALREIMQEFAADLKVKQLSNNAQ